MKMLMIVMLAFAVSAIVSCSKDKEDPELKSTYEFKSKTGYEKDENSNTAGEPNGLKSVECRNAARHVGDSVRVTGYVADVIETPKVIYLNFEKKFPKNTFTCAVFPANAARFGDLKLFAGRTVEVTGKITTFRNKPQMILWTEAQIKILK